MAIIYSYPRLNTTAATGDLLLITDINDDNKTKSVAISNLPFTNNAGTVTSVGVSMPSAFAVANSPVTGSNTIAITGTGGSTGQFLAYPGTSWATPSLGTGTQYKLPMWATTTTLGDSIITEDPGFGITVAGTLTITGGSNYLYLPSILDNFGSQGSANQVLTAGGSGGSIQWQTVTGTVSSVSGTGTVDGLTLSGTVNTTGNLTLGGSIDLREPSNTTTPSLQISGANATDANSGGAGQAFSDAQGVLNLQGLSSNYNATVMAISGEDNVANSAGNLINFFMASHLGPGYTLVGRIQGDRSAGTVSFSNVSDYRVKKNVTSMTGSLNKIKALNPVNYNITDIYEDPNPLLIEGFLAHELQAQIPNAVTGAKDAVNEDGSIKAQTVDLVKIIPNLVGAIKELTARIEALEA
tara:strand:- start:44 stop:1276 length:1233 start_codon:yes stop_codon:yes gene_type:complete